MDNLITELERWNSEEQNYSTAAKVEDTVIEKDKLIINLVEEETNDSLSLEISMTPTNISLLKKQLAKAEVGQKRNTDAKGRFNLGVEHADEEKRVLILN